jgi:hypothetical protein
MPGHFRPTRHEPRIVQRYHEIQQRLPQLREHKLKKKHALKKRE